ncbi:hypothetical protein ACFQRD_07755 [Brachybacterium sp. GCM10030268]|uniref:hypothetical protein n=1 Tax=Brachybacterium sp. GCM10030268 TaxID=3273382 RepID=UPI0036228FE2
MRRRHRLTELEQREHLALRFGLILRRDFGPLAVREGASSEVRRALAVPYYSLLHHANVVPRAATAQRGRLIGSIAVQVDAAGLSARAVSARAEQIARVLIAEYDAHGIIYGVRATTWDSAAGTGRVDLELASSADVPSQHAVTGGDLTPVLTAMLEAVRPAGTELAVVRDPFDVREQPASSWRWVFPIRSGEAVEEFHDLHREMSFAVLSRLVTAQPRDLRPLKSVPAHYVDLPGGQ